MKFNQLIRRPFKYSYYNASFIIIGINLIVFLITSLFPRIQSILALNVIYVVKGHAFWQFLTYMFLHGSFSHVLFNMLGVLFFGIAIEKAIGSKEFLLLYFLSGILCGVISFVIYYFSGAYTVFLLGASGAIYALLLAYAVIFPRANIYIWGILPIPAPILIAVYAGIEIASQLFSIQNGVAHMTHLAGFFVAFIYFIVRMGINPWKVWVNAYK